MDIVPPTKRDWVHIVFPIAVADDWEDNMDPKLVLVMGKFYPILVLIMSPLLFIYTNAVPSDSVQQWSEDMKIRIKLTKISWILTAQTTTAVIKSWRAHAFSQIIMTIILYDIPSLLPGKAWSPNTWKVR